MARNPYRDYSHVPRIGENVYEVYIPTDREIEGQTSGYGGGFPLVPSARTLVLLALAETYGHASVITDAALQLLSEALGGAGALQKSIAKASHSLGSLVDPKHYAVDPTRQMTQQQRKTLGRKIEGNLIKCHAELVAQSKRPVWTVWCSESVSQLLLSCLKKEGDDLPHLDMEQIRRWIAPPRLPEFDGCLRHRKIHAAWSLPSSKRDQAGSLMLPAEYLPILFHKTYSGMPSHHKTATVSEMINVPDLPPVRIEDQQTDEAWRLKQQRAARLSQVIGQGLKSSAAGDRLVTKRPSLPFKTITQHVALRLRKLEKTIDTNTINITSIFDAYRQSPRLGRKLWQASHREMKGWQEDFFAHKTFFEHWMFVLRNRAPGVPWYQDIGVSLLGPGRDGLEVGLLAGQTSEVGRALASLLAHQSFCVQLRDIIVSRLHELSGEGVEGYFVKQGYKQQIAKPSKPLEDAWIKNVVDSDSLYETESEEAYEGPGTRWDKPSIRSRDHSEGRSSSAPSLDPCSTSPVNEPRKQPINLGRILSPDRLSEADMPVFRGIHAMLADGSGVAHLTGKRKISDDATLDDESSYSDSEQGLSGGRERKRSKFHHEASANKQNARRSSSHGSIFDCPDNSAHASATNKSASTAGQHSFSYRRHKVRQANSAAASRTDLSALDRLGDSIDNGATDISGLDDHASGMTMY